MAGPNTPSKIISSFEQLEPNDQIIANALAKMDDGEISKRELDSLIEQNPSDFAPSHWYHVIEKLNSEAANELEKEHCRILSKEDVEAMKKGESVPSVLDRIVVLLNDFYSPEVSPLEQLGKEGQEKVGDILEQLPKSHPNDSDSNPIIMASKSPQLGENPTSTYERLRERERAIVDDLLEKLSELDNARTIATSVLTSHQYRVSPDAFQELVGLIDGLIHPESMQVDITNAQVVIEEKERETLSEFFERNTSDETEPLRPAVPPDNEEMDQEDEPEISPWDSISEIKRTPTGFMMVQEGTPSPQSPASGTGGTPAAAGPADPNPESADTVPMNFIDPTEKQQESPYEQLEVADQALADELIEKAGRVNSDREKLKIINQVCVAHGLSITSLESIELMRRIPHLGTQIAYDSEAKQAESEKLEKARKNVSIFVKKKRDAQFENGSTTVMSVDLPTEQLPLDDAHVPTEPLGAAVDKESDRLRKIEEMAAQLRPQIKSVLELEEKILSQVSEMMFELLEVYGYRINGLKNHTIVVDPDKIEDVLKVVETALRVYSLANIRVDSSEDKLTLSIKTKSVSMFPPRADKPQTV